MGATPVSKTETEGGVSKVFGYSYDTVGRLIEVSENGVVTESYEYDLNGNRTQSFNSAGSFSATFDEQDRILTYGSLTFTWTPNGEMASKTDTATGEVTTYSYDALGNLREVVLPDGTDITYLVDGQGRRVGKLVNGAFERGWLWSNDLSPAAELNGNGVVVKRFVYTEGLNVPDLMMTAGGTYTLQRDHLGGVRAVFDTTTGAQVERRVYDSWGQLQTDTEPGLQPFGFAGGLADASTGLVHFGARDYDPRLGRWSRRDPALFVGGPDFFAYARSNPINERDPLGLESGDCYPTQLDAALAALQDYNFASIALDVEFAGLIYHSPKSGCYSYTSGKPGTKNTSTPTATAYQCSPSDDVVGDFHTHAAFHADTDEQFSPRDLMSADALGSSIYGYRSYTSYLATPSGRVGIYDGNGEPFYYAPSSAYGAP